jgi:hypothetical protein
MSKRYLCNKCNNEYSSKNGLRRHLDEKHGFLAFLRRHKWILSIITIISIISSIILFYLNNKPDLEIDSGSVNWEKLEYTIKLTNYGKSKANNIEIDFDLNYFKGQISTLQYLGPGQSSEFTFKLAYGDVFMENVTQILKGEKGGLWI